MGQGGEFNFMTQRFQVEEEFGGVSVPGPVCEILMRLSLKSEEGVGRRNERGDEPKFGKG